MKKIILLTILILFCNIVHANYYAENNEYKVYSNFYSGKSENTSYNSANINEPLGVGLYLQDNIVRIGLLYIQSDFISSIVPSGGASGGRKDYTVKSSIYELRFLVEEPKKLQTLALVTGFDLNTTRSYYKKTDKVYYNLSFINKASYSDNNVFLEVFLQYSNGTVLGNNSFYFAYISPSCEVGVYDDTSGACVYSSSLRKPIVYSVSGYFEFPDNVSYGSVLLNSTFVSDNQEELNIFKVISVDKGFFEKYRWIILTIVLLLIIGTIITYFYTKDDLW